MLYLNLQVHVGQKPWWLHTIKSSLKTKITHKTKPFEQLYITTTMTIKAQVSQHPGPVDEASPTKYRLKAPSILQNQQQQITTTTCIQQTTYIIWTIS